MPTDSMPSARWYRPLLRHVGDGRAFYQPDDPFCRQREPDDKRWGLDHFYRKLLRIPDGLHTATARAIASERLGLMKSFLEQLGHEIQPDKPASLHTDTR